MAHSETNSEFAGSKEGFKADEFEAVWTGQGDPSGSPQRDDHGDLSVEDAANLLGITAKAVIKRLQRGSLPGRKIEVKGVQQWRVRHGDWTRDARVEISKAAGDLQGPTKGSPLSREDLNALLVRLEELQHDINRPQMMIDRGSEIEELQRQLIGSQQLIMRIQEEKQLQSLRLVELETEAKLLPDMHAKTIEQTKQIDILLQENMAIKEELNILKNGEASKTLKWWQILFGLR